MKNGHINAGWERRDVIIRDRKEAFEVRGDLVTRGEHMIGEGREGMLADRWDSVAHIDMAAADEQRRSGQPRGDA
jgi:hypothetical protein